MLSRVIIYHFHTHLNKTRELIKEQIYKKITAYSYSIIQTKRLFIVEIDLESVAIECYVMYNKRHWRLLNEYKITYKEKAETGQPNRKLIGY